MTTETLMGWPVVVMNNDKYTPNNNYVTTAANVRHGMVLNGEERREILSVPTCQVPMDQVATIYIDADRRTVAVHNGTDISLRSTVTQMSTSNNNNKERVVQALLLKWTVVRLEKARKWE